MKQRLIAMLVGLALSRGLRLGALAAQLDKEAHGKLDKALQPLYKANGDSFVLDVEGGEDVSGLKSALEKEKTANKGHAKQLKDLQDRLQLFDGLDPDAVRTLIKQVGEGEDAALMKAGKWDELLAKKMQAANAAHAKEKEAWEKDKQLAQAGRKQLLGLIVDQAVTQASVKAGAHAAGIEDALLRARSVFGVDGENRVVQMDAEGKPVLGKDGKTPITPVEWIEGMKETAPHWFSINGSGSGGHGSREKGGKRVVKRSEFNAMDAAARAKTAKDPNVQLVD